MPEERLIGGLEADVRHINEAVADLRDMMTDQLRQTVTTNQRLTQLEAEVAKLQTAQDGLKSEMTRLSLIMSGGGMLAGGGLMKLLASVGG